MPRISRRNSVKPAWDVIVANYQLSDFSALNALGLLAGEALDIPFIVFSDAAGEEAVVAVLRAGAHDYILPRAFRQADPGHPTRVAQRGVPAGTVAR